MNSEKLFFSYRLFTLEGDTVGVSSLSEISGGGGYAKEYLQKVLENGNGEGEKFKITLKKGFDSVEKEAIGSIYADDEENYALFVNCEEKSIKLCGNGDRGLIYAVSTLKQLMEIGGVSSGIIFDYPDVKMRGYRVYTPGRGQIEDFKKMIDDLVYYKYNAVMIEVGGAMEYKSHPKINEVWTAFCQDLYNNPGKADQIELHTYPWRKDSIHYENGAGGCITQDEMRDVVEYCRERGFEVIPEVPTHSHSDYIVHAYPHLAERKDDKWPDTYCPSEPETYEIVFALMEEIIDVFKPKYMNIGHDEFYSACKCDKCKDKNPIDVYVGDIEKINNYLKTKGITAIMWCDKLFENLEFTDWDGLVYPFGARPDPKKDIPSLIGCKYKVPRDVMMLNWSYSKVTAEEEKELYDMGFRMFYGNFNAMVLDDYRERSKFANGAFMSNWGYIEEEYMQRNLQWYALLCDAYIFWDSDYTSKDRDKVYKKVSKSLYDRHLKRVGKEYIEICHTTDFYQKHKSFWCGTWIEDKDWHMGDYVITYDDGTKEKLPVRFGWNILNDTAFTKKEDGTIVIDDSSAAKEAIGASCPYLEDDKVYYKTAYKNPYPEKKIENITYEAVIDADVKLMGYKEVK